MKGKQIGDQKSAKFAPDTPQVPNHYTGPGSRDRYPKKGAGKNGMDTFKSKQTEKSFAPGAAQRPDVTVGHGSKNAYPKRGLPSFDTKSESGLKKPMSGMPKAL